MKRMIPLASGLVLLAGIALLSFVAVRILTDDSSDDIAVQGQTEATAAPDPLHAALLADSQKPRFVGEIQGIYISPYEESVPEQHRLPPCASPAQFEVPWDQAGQFALDVQLPPKFIHQPEDMNTGVIACEGLGAYVARWAYELPQPQFVDYPGRIIISRGLGSWVSADASTDRVKTIDAGGRQAILVEPIRPEGSGSLGQNGTQAAVIFPETFGKTSVTSIGVPLSDLLEVAAIVGSATKN